MVQGLGFGVHDTGFIVQGPGVTGLNLGCRDWEETHPERLNAAQRTQSMSCVQRSPFRV